MQYYGTHHFVSLQGAHRYYADYGLGFKDVERKIQEKEIAIGPPQVKEGQRLTLIDGGRRYAIIET